MGNLTNTTVTAGAWTDLITSDMMCAKFALVNWYMREEMEKGKFPEAYEDMATLESR